jgi:hypothetical protein
MRFFSDSGAGRFLRSINWLAWMGSSGFPKVPNGSLATVPSYWRCPNMPGRCSIKEIPTGLQTRRRIGSLSLESSHFLDSTRTPTSTVQSRLQIDPSRTANYRIKGERDEAFSA